MQTLSVERDKTMQKKWKRSRKSLQAIALKFASTVYIGLLAYVLWSAWLIRDERYITAEHGIGYLLGIVGGVSFLMMLIYPWRKRKKFPAYAGGVKFWFRVHMALGIFAPTIIVLHSNFSLGSFNSRISMYCMFLVASSGLVGRYLYTKIHYGLSDKQTVIKSRVLDVIESMDKLSQLVKYRITKTGSNETDFLSIDDAERSRILKLVETNQWGLRSVLISFENKINNLAFPDTKNEINDSLKEIRVSIRSARMLVIFERLFSLWHIIHIPFFIMLVITVIFHILAVHMY